MGSFEEMQKRRQEIYDLSLTFADKLKGQLDRGTHNHPHEKLAQEAATILKRGKMVAFSEEETPPDPRFLALSGEANSQETREVRRLLDALEHLGCTIQMPAPPQPMRVLDITAC